MVSYYRNHCRRAGLEERKKRTWGVPDSQFIFEFSLRYGTLQMSIGVLVRTAYCSDSLFYDICWQIQCSDCLCSVIFATPTHCSNRSFIGLSSSVVVRARGCKHSVCGFKSNSYLCLQNLFSLVASGPYVLDVTCPRLNNSNQLEQSIVSVS